MLDGRQEEDKVVAEGRFCWVFLLPSPRVVLPGMSPLFGPSGLQVSAVRVIWGAVAEPGKLPALGRSSRPTSSPQSGASAGGRGKGGAPSK